MGRVREIDIHCEHPGLKFEEDHIERLFACLDELPEFGIPEGELSIAFLTEASHCQLHADFLDDPSPTDVITFPAEGEPGFAGEICVNPDYAKAQHQEFGQSFSEELTLYLAHGWLHLAGLDDRTQEAAQKMRLGEKIAMEWLRHHEAIPAFEFKEG